MDPCGIQDSVEGGWVRMNFELCHSCKGGITAKDVSAFKTDDEINPVPMDFDPQAMSGDETHHIYIVSPSGCLNSCFQNFWIVVFASLKSKSNDAIIRLNAKMIWKF